MYGFVSSTGALAEIWSLTAIAVDRMLAVHFPFNPTKHLNRTQVYRSNKYLHHSTVLQYTKCKREFGH